MSVDFPPGTRKYFVLIGVCFLIIALCMVADGATFNLTANVSEKWILWSFDNDTYTVSVDGSTPANFTGEAYLATNLRANTMHMITLANATNTTTDVQITDKAFWDSDYFIFLILALFFGMISFKWPWFAPVSVIISGYAMMYTIWTSGLTDIYSLIMGLVMVGCIWRMGALK